MVASVAQHIISVMSLGTVPFDRTFLISVHVEAPLFMKCRHRAPGVAKTCDYPARTINLGTAVVQLTCHHSLYQHLC